MMHTTSELLRTLRGERTQREIAASVGIAPSAYSMYERGERTPRDRIKRKIASLYGISVQELFFDSTELDNTEREQ